MAEKATDTARDHLERAVAWLTDCDRELAGTKMHIATARAEVEHALWLLDTIPPRVPTEAMIRAAWKEVFDHTNGSNHLLDSGVPAIWRAMYDAALAEKEGE